MIIKKVEKIEYKKQKSTIVKRAYERICNNLSFRIFEE